MTTSTTLIDPAALTPSQWSVRLAAYLSRARGDDDPEVVAARQALASWRCRRVIDAEAGQFGAGRSRRSDARLRGFKDEAAPSHAP